MKTVTEIMTNTDMVNKFNNDHRQIIDNNRYYEQLRLKFTVLK